MPPKPPETLWTVGDRECLLCRVEGRYELQLRVQGRTTRLQTFPDEGTARRSAAEWRKATETRTDF